MGWGAAAGLAGVVGTSLLYQGLAIGRMSVVTGLEFVEKLLTANLTSMDTTERNVMLRVPPRRIGRAGY